MKAYKINEALSDVLKGPDRSKIENIIKDVEKKMKKYPFWVFYCYADFDNVWYEFFNNFEKAGERLRYFVFNDAEENWDIPEFIHIHGVPDINKFVISSVDKDIDIQGAPLIEEIRLQ